MQMIQSGLPTAVIAAQIGRSPDAIKSHLLTHDSSITQVRAAAREAVYTPRQLCPLFHVSYRAVTRWLDQGELGCNLSGPRSGRNVPLITGSHLRAFVAVRAAWPDYQPRQIADMALQWRAVQLRSQAGGEWLSAEQAAARCHVIPDTVRYWLRQGWLPFVERSVRRYIWSEDLIGFEIPLNTTERAYKGAATRRARRDAA